MLNSFPSGLLVPIENPIGTKLYVNELSLSFLNKTAALDQPQCVYLPELKQ